MVPGILSIFLNTGLSDNLSKIVLHAILKIVTVVEASSSLSIVLRKVDTQSSLYSTLNLYANPSLSDPLVSSKYLLASTQCL